MSWGSTEESSYATYYEVYLAGNANGASRSILGRANSTADSLSVAVETTLSPFCTYNLHGLLAGGADDARGSSNLRRVSSVSNVFFSDQDVDLGE